MKEKVVLIGAGGHAKVIIDILNQNGNYEIIGCLDKSYREKGKILGCDVIGDDSMIPKLYSRGIKKAFVALGDNKLRHRISKNLISRGFSLVNAISEKSYIARSVRLGSGIAVMAGAVINPDTIIGDNVIINTNVSIDHDCNIGESCHIAPGANLSGNVSIGVGTFLGTGCKVRDKINIGEWSVVGVGSAVVGDIPSHSLAYGVPARVKN